MKPKSVHFLLLILLLLLLPRISTAQESGRTVVMGSLVDVFTIDPAIAFDQATGSSVKQLYDSLFRYTGNLPELQPWLAESWEVSEDGLTYTLQLHDTAQFHDGSPVDAAAVVYSAERLLRVGQGPASLFAGILAPGKTQAVDTFTVQFSLEQPYSPFLDLLSWLFIVNPAVVEANLGSDDGVSFLSANAAGSGPYTIAAWNPGSSYEFVAVENYWRGWPSENYPTRVIRRVIPDSSQRRLAIATNEVDFVDWMSTEDMVDLSSGGGITSAITATIQVFDIKMNTVHGPTSDPNLRRAIAYGVDYEAMAELWLGQGTLLNGPLPPALSTREEPLYRRDLGAARDALAESNYPDGVEIEYVYVEGLEIERLVGVVLQESLADLGITINVRAMAWPDAVATFGDPTTSPSMFPLFSLTAFADPDNFLWTGFHSSQAGVFTNSGHYANPAVDALLEQARSTIDPDERASLYAQAEEQILADAPNLFIVSVPDAHLAGPRIANYQEQFNPVMGSTEDFYFYEVR